MAPVDLWEKIKVEWEQLYSDPGYKPLRPLLDALEPVIATRRYDPPTTQGVLALVRRLRELQQKGHDPKELAAEVAGGFINKEMDVGGPLLQAQRDVIYQVFNLALPELKPANTGIPVAIVLLAMTAAEAESLAGETAFAGQLDALRDDFRRLTQHLQANGYGDWKKHYGAKPEDWRPSGEQTIAQSIEDALSLLNESGELSKPLVAKFYDIRAMDNADPRERSLLRRLRTAGCVVIIDSISMRHPALLRAFQRSLLDVFPSTSVVTLAPNEQAFGLMRNMVHALQMSFEESEFNFRLLDPMERQACQEYSDVRKLSPWFLDRVMRIYSSSPESAVVREQMKF